MNPARLSAHLRNVADKIDRSRNPSRSLVATELKRVLAVMVSPEDQEEQDQIGDLTKVKPGKSDVREYVPVGKDSPYAVIDGRFEFTLPGGQSCVWDGRMDHDNVDGTLTVDGKDMTDVFLGQGDTPTFDELKELIMT